MKYQDYVKEYNQVWGYITTYGKDKTDEVNEIRGYYNCSISEGTCYVLDDWSKIENASKELALFTKKGNPLLGERYLVPVKDFKGNVIAIIGWYKDSKKYITTPSKYFKRDILYFGMELVPQTLGGGIVVVEGIFDALRMRSLGVPTIAMQGVQSSVWKKALLKGYKRVLAIPDNDRAGREVISKNGWGLQSNGTYVNWRGVRGIKDVDEIITRAGKEGVLHEISEVAKVKGSLVYTIELC